MQKKLWLVPLFIFFILIPGWVSAEEIVTFDVTARIKEDASVDISERIQYDFGIEQKHGIFRNIPYKYKSDSGSHTSYFSDFSVTDQNGNQLQYSLSKQDSDVVLKIGDPNITITGTHTYKIDYTVKGVIDYFKNKDVWYWNILGNEWSVPIRSVSASIFLPANTDLQKINFFCYEGALGSTDFCQNANQGNPIRIKQNNLFPGNGITVRIDFAKGMMAQPNQIENIFIFLKDNIILFLPIAVALILLAIWIKYGRDPKGQGVVITQFDTPDNLTPAEVGAIFDQRVDNKDVSAEIINLARQGYLRINRLEKRIFLSTSRDYEFLQLKTAEGLDNQHDAMILVALFGEQAKTGVAAQSVLLSSFKKNAFVYKKIKASKKALYTDLVTRGYFKSNPNTIREIFVTIGVIIIVLVSEFFFDSLNSVSLLSLAISAVIIILFGFIMPALTKKGVHTREYILGLKNYLQVAEKDRLEFHNAPEKNPEQFEKLLPFAMALGVEKQWARQFEGIYLSPPSWYGGYVGGQFSSIAFTSALTDFNSSLKSVGFGGAGSSGGGGVGGGGGGGGGGSW